MFVGLIATVITSGPFGNVPSPPFIELPKSVISDRSKLLDVEDLFSVEVDAEPPEARREYRIVPPTITSP